MTRVQSKDPTSTQRTAPQSDRYHLPKAKTAEVVPLALPTDRGGRIEIPSLMSLFGNQHHAYVATTEATLAAVARFAETELGMADVEVLGISVECADHQRPRTQAELARNVDIDFVVWGQTQEPWVVRMNKFTGQCANGGVWD